MPCCLQGGVESLLYRHFCTQPALTMYAALPNEHMLRNAMGLLQGDLNDGCRATAEEEWKAYGAVE